MELALAIIGIIAALIPIAWSLYKRYYGEAQVEKERRAAENEAIEKRHGEDRKDVVEVGKSVDKILSRSN
jgi:type II secretory pathway pseudopilin PulG